MNTIQTTTTPSAANTLPVTYFVAAGIPAFLLVFTQWRLSQLTGSVLVMGQGVLLLSLLVALLLVMVDTRWRWHYVAQLINSLIMVVLCGYLINESYIHWQEEQLILTADALPVTLLGCGGPLLLSRLVFRGAGAGVSKLGKTLGTIILPLLSGGLAMAMLIIHFTGWEWLDSMAGASTAVIVGLIAIGFLLDAYWNLIEWDLTDN